MNKKKLLFISLCIFQTLFMTGCWDRTELNDLAIALATAADIEEDDVIRTTVQFALPGKMGGATSGGGGGGAEDNIAYVDSDVGTTLREAVGKMQRRMSQRITFSHRRVFIVSEELAKKGIRDMFDTTARVAQNRLSAYIIVAKGKAYDLLKAEPQFERFSGENILYLAEARGVISVNMRQAAQSISSFGSDTILAYMTVTKSQLSNEISDEIEFLGYAQFRDDKMVGIFEGEQAHGLMWLRNELSPYTTIVEIKEDKYAAINIKNGRIQIKPKLKEDHIEFSIKIDINANLVEDFSRSDMTKLNDKDLFNRKLEEHIKAAVEGAVKVIQENKADSANLGLLVNRHFPKQWEEKYGKNWYEELSKAKFTIIANANITDAGLVSENISKGEEPE
ncbi:Ger(x)C family spore germination protein [Chengkuizengella axinellae]|uniref:Ger(X)C family spore germination protein n=1 Tax=Chengkuizengella axinellae TaxID=3064388 RepID=A0ABT9J4W5_9BACL|nr:Ger(x)C family spore germination protein [Chengkuizengella sp. 2205SS18-9]MDP5276664.1 Ger(x)C family spore germination protein [Chengkuizengella sp. 2205SS18-9]